MRPTKGETGKAIVKLMRFIFFFDKNDSLYRLPAAKNNNILKMYLLSKALGIVSNNYIMGLQKPAAEVGSFFPC